MKVWKCNDCRACIDVCPKGILVPSSDNVVRAHEWIFCDGCSACVKVCKNRAISLKMPRPKVFKRTVYYFDEHWYQNTNKVIELVRKRILETGVKHIVVASMSGSTAVKFAEALKDLKTHIVCVTGPPSWKEFGYPCPMISERMHELLDKYKIEVVDTVEEPLGDTDFFHWWDKKVVKVPSEVMYEVLVGIGGYGLKTAVEAVMMAVEDGKVPVGEDVIGAAGHDTGADAAVIMKATKFKEALGENKDKRLYIKEIIAMPRKKIRYW